MRRPSRTCATRLPEPLSRGPCPRLSLYACVLHLYLAVRASVGRSVCRLACRCLLLQAMEEETTPCVKVFWALSPQTLCVMGLKEAWAGFWLRSGIRKPHSRKRLWPKRLFLKTGKVRCSLWEGREAVESRKHREGSSRTCRPHSSHYCSHGPIKH